MNTTAAAIEANVTVATIRTWARNGVIAATKTAGRWIIDATSLARRIAIGKTKEQHVTEQPKYTIEEATKVEYGKERTVYRVVRTDGTPAGFKPGCDRRIWTNTYYTRETAEIYREFYERTPNGFRLEKQMHRSSSIRSGAYWEVTGSTEGDPREVRHTWDEGTEVHSNWPAGTTWLDVLISIVNRHADGAPKRIAEKAEQDAIEAAEAAVREARQAQMDAVRAQKGDLATPRQVDFILQLLADRQRSGEGGGFFIGPTNRAGIEELSKREASSYITSLKGDY